MAFADPITVTVNAVAQVLPRVYQPVPGGPSTFKLADETFKVEISHQEVKGKRERHMFKITQKAVTANPFVPAENIENFASAYIVVDNPKQGFTDAQLGYLMNGITAFMNGSASNTSKFIGGEA
jgi:hypothetical protein